MDSGTRNHILRESIISMLFNAAFSLAFAWLLFRDSATVARRELVFDAAPQSFFVAFFGVLIPTLMTRRRLGSGSLSALPYRATHLPANLFLRAVTMGLLAAIAGVALHVLVLYSVGIDELNIAAVLSYKPVYGAMLSWIVTPFALLVVLSNTSDSP